VRGTARGTLSQAAGRGRAGAAHPRPRQDGLSPFGGLYRIIDLHPVHCINSDLRRVMVLTQLQGSKP